MSFLFLQHMERCENMYTLKIKISNWLLKLVNKFTPIETVAIFYIYDENHQLIAKTLADGDTLDLSEFTLPRTFYISDMGNAIIYR